MKQRFVVQFRDCQLVRRQLTFKIPQMRCGRIEFVVTKIIMTLFVFLTRFQQFSVIYGIGIERKKATRLKIVLETLIMSFLAVKEKFLEFL